MSLLGVIFDLDGTLVDSKLDFNAMRREMGFPAGQPILEGIAQLSDPDTIALCHSILRVHEMRGAHQASLMPFAAELLAHLNGAGIPQAVLTRNSREATEIILGRLGLSFSQVKTREDIPAKPNPRGLLEICAAWEIGVEQAIFVGDYLFDVQAGRNVGIRTILYAPRGLPDYATLADFTIGCFREAIPLLTDLRSDILT